MKKLLLFLGISALLFTACKKEEDLKPPEAGFSASVNEMEASFTNTSSGEIDSYAWDFGDGKSSTGKNATHTYDAGGEYTVKLTVVNDAGSDTHKKTITIEEASSGSGEEATSGTPTFGDMDGALYAINTSSFQTVGGFPVETKLGSAVGVFLDGSGNYVGAGSVKADGHSLSQNPNNTYTWTATDGTTKFSGNVPWDVTGGNGFSAFTYTVTLGFPSVSEVNSSSTVNTSSSYTLGTTNSITGADSVLFHISGPDGNTVTKTTAGSQSSYTFSSSELSGLSSGNGIAQVAAYTFTSNTFGGKKIYFVNESVVSINVTIQ